METRFVSVAEAAAFLGISLPTAARWLKTKKLPSIRIGGKRLIAIEVLHAIEKRAMVGDAAEGQK